MEIRKRGRLRILAVILSFCVLLTAYPNMPETIFVFAAEEAAGTEEPYVTAGEGGSAEESGPSDSKPGDAEPAGGTEGRDTEPAGGTEDSDTGTGDGQDAQPEEGKAAEETDDTAVTDGGDEADTEAEEDGAGESTPSEEQDESGFDSDDTAVRELLVRIAALPAWATGEDSVSIVIRFENKKPSSGGGNSSGGHNDGSGADGNNGDGGSSDGNGGESGNGDGSSSDGNNGNTPEKGAHPGAPAVTPPPAAAPQPPTRIGSLKQPQPSDMADSRPEEEQEPESPGTSEPTEKPSEKDQAQQSEEDGEQTIPAAVENGKIVISGERVATGNVKGMTDKRTVLRLEKGAVIVTVVCAEQEYAAGVADTIAIANAVLAPEQIELIHNGEAIEIRIDVKDISEKVPAQDKKAIESGIEAYQKEVTGLVLGMYVDISMFIKIGAGDWNAVTETDQPVEMVIGIPETLQSGGREFYIIRAHGGEYTFMNDLDDAQDTITVSTDRFSSYAIAYVETEGTGAGSRAKCGLCHICPTFLGGCCFIWLAIIITAVIIAIIVILWRNKQAAHEADPDI